MDWAKHMRRILVRIGEDAVYTPASGVPFTVRVLYLQPYQAQLGIVAGSAPEIAVMAADVPTLAQNDYFTLRGLSFSVMTPKPDPISGITACPVQAGVPVENGYIALEDGTSFLLESGAQLLLEA